MRISSWVLVLPALLVSCSSPSPLLPMGEKPDAALAPLELDETAVLPDPLSGGADPAGRVTDGRQVLAPIPGPPRITGLAHTPGTLWLGGPDGLWRLELAARTLQPVYLPLSVPASVTAVVGGPDRLYLGLGTAGRIEHLARLELRTGALARLETSGPPGPLARDGDRLWLFVGGGGGQLSRAGGGVGLADSFAWTPALAGEPPVALAARSDQVLAVAPDGAALRLTPSTGRWEKLLEPGDGAGPILGITAYRDGFALSTATRGLIFVDAGGTRRSLEPSLRLHHLTASGVDLWGIEAGRLVRFDGAAGRVEAFSAPRPLAGVSGLVVASEGVWVACDEGVYQLESPSGLALAIQGGPDPAPAPVSEAEIEDLLRVIAGMTPPERRAAYQALLTRAPPGYDEVFLVGLNEDDPNTLEVVATWFRTHHPVQAIEPLLDVLLTVQGDRAMRDHVAGVLETFGPPAVVPVAMRLTSERPEVLDGGARKALERVLVGAVDRGGPGALNEFLARARPDWLLAYGAAEMARGVPPPVNAETFRLLARRLSGPPDDRAIEGALRAVIRLARGPDLPVSVAQLVPALISHLEGPHRRWALYALALVGDARATGPCERIARSDPEHRFWALQALAATGDPGAFPAFIGALSDERPEVRDAAAFILRTELVLEGAPPLRRLLAGQQGALCTSCVEALGLLRDEAARPVLEAHLSSAGPDEQALLLEALLTMSDAPLAARLRGWIDLELLAPARVGRRSLESPADRRALSAALVIVAVDGGEEGRRFLESVRDELPGGAVMEAGEALRLAEALPAGLSRVLERAILGRSGSGWPGVPFVLPVAAAGPSTGGVSAEAALAGIDASSFSSIRPMLFLLAPRKADADTRAVLERILLTAERPPDREQAGRALFSLASPASIPALIRALEDPWFQDGPFPLYRYPVRHVAARALDRLGRRVVKQADRRFRVL